LKFLIVQKVNPGTPVQKVSKLLPAQMKYIQELRKEHKIELYYHLIGQEGHMIVCDVGSEEELSAILIFVGTTIIKQGSARLRLAQSAI